MDYPFAYNKPVTGKMFYGRKQDVARMISILNDGGSIALYGAPKSGKMSLIQETMYQMKLSKASFRVAEVQLLDVRDGATFLSRMCESAIRAYATTAEEYDETVSTFFSGTHVCFDPEAFSSFDRIVTMNGALEREDIAAMLSFPYRLAESRGIRLFVILREFQNLRFIENWEMHFKAMETIMKRERDCGRNYVCSWIVTGSQLNAMKDIFEHTKYFYKLIEPCRPTPFEAKDITERILRGFLSSGKVVERAQIERICRVFRNNIWYINHFVSICDHLSKGYITEPVLQEALDTMISLNLPRFCSEVNDLTNFQVNLLRAMAEGKTRFSSADIIRSYGLNSSANVKRVKDALAKKEIITFSDTDDASFIDPLFEFWIKKEFFSQKVEF